jgi:glycogen debranching enzyme
MEGKQLLWETGYKSLKECLDDEWGILASDRSSTYGTLFGRDALITASLLLDTLARQPDPDLRKLAQKGAEASLRNLIRLQGKDERDKNEEQPGKIIHEYWSLPTPRLRQWGWPLVEGRYYGSIDATPLFIIVAAQFLQAFPASDLRPDLEKPLALAMGWLERFAFDHNGGLVAYHRRNPGQGVIHQVWKDAGPDTIMMPDLRQAPEPVAWVELQAYAAAAVREYNALRRSLLPKLPETQLKGSKIAEHLEKDFYSREERGLVMAIDGHGDQVPVASSNQGHALWAGAVGIPMAREIASRLLEPDLLTDSGIRTVSSDSYLYNPWSRQRGAIWPHDCAMIAVGMMRYALTEEAKSIAIRVADGIEHFGSAVELYSLLDKEELIDPEASRDTILAFTLPNHYASTHQAWSAAGLLYLSTLL